MFFLFFFCQKHTLGIYYLYIAGTEKGLQHLVNSHSWQYLEILIFPKCHQKCVGCFQTPATDQLECGIRVFEVYKSPKIGKPEGPGLSLHLPTEV